MWEERVSDQYKKDTKIDSEIYFRNYVRNRLKIEQSYCEPTIFNDRWCVNNVFGVQRKDYRAYISAFRF